MHSNVSIASGSDFLIPLFLGGDALCLHTVNRLWTDPAASSSLLTTSSSILLAPILIWNRFSALQSDPHLPESYEALVRIIQYLYEQRDPEESGLPVLLNPGESILPQASYWQSCKGPLQEPAHLALLCWALECLIQLGKKLKKDTHTLIQWQELTTFSVNDQLWNEEYHIYLPFDCQKQELIFTGSVGGLLPMIADLPDQERAEGMAMTLSLNFQAPGHHLLPLQTFYPDGSDEARPQLIQPLFQWLLFYGLLRFELTDLAMQVQDDSRLLLETQGIRSTYKSKIRKRKAIQEPGAELTAAILQDLSSAPLQHPCYLD